MARLLSLLLAALALLTTTAVLCTQIVLSSHIHHDSPGRTASITSAALEFAVLLLLGWLCATSLSPAIRDQSQRRLGIVFGLGLMVCTLATAASITALVYLGKATHNAQTNIIIGSSVALGLSLPSQLSFMVAHFVSARIDILGINWSIPKDEEAGRPCNVNIKSIRYSQTSPTTSQSEGIPEMKPRGRSDSTGGKSAAETILSSMNSVSHAMRTSSFKAKLRPSKEKGRPESQDSSPNRSSGDDTFESWDTSTVDLHNRQAVLEMTSPTQASVRGLETIPASPMASRSPSPGSQPDLEPPHVLKRSHSPVSLRRELPTPTTPHGSISESHIHPLFRTDSPDPHPIATPGTIVVAAPDAARVVVHRASTRSLGRMRSSSLLVAPSPLSKQGSFEDARRPKTQRSEVDTIPAPESSEFNTQAETLRKMTPPVPEWLLSGRAETQ